MTTATMIEAVTRTKDRILLLVENRADRDMLAALLAGEQTDVMTPDGPPEENIQRPFDLCLVDGATLERRRALLEARREREGAYLPTLLLTGRHDIGMMTADLWKVIDEIIVKPIERIELLARVEALLHARRQALALRLYADDLEAFVHVMAHDLRAPARIVGQFANSLAEDHTAQLDEQGRHIVDRIAYLTGGMLELLEDLLEYSRLGAARPIMESVDVQALLDEVLTTMEEQVLDARATVRVEGALARAEADKRLLRLALQNLLSNAIKFVGPGVRPQVTVRGHREGPVCVIEVEDNGIGVPADDHARIFDPFVRLHGEEAYPGTGLGLSIARKSMSLMRRRIGVRSGLDQGSVFWLELECAQT